MKKSLAYILKIFISLTLSYNIAYACDGDCIKCHPNLIRSGSLDKDHEVLAKCIECHKISSDDLNRMGSLCGQDCWECHNVKKVMTIKNVEHLALNDCIDCHKKLKEKNFFIKQNSTFNNLFQKL